jgi:hypothetical protein
MDGRPCWVPALESAREAESAHITDTNNVRSERKTKCRCTRSQLASCDLACPPSVITERAVLRFVGSRYPEACPAALTSILEIL